MKIRYFGFLAHIKKQAVVLIRSLLGITMNVEKTKEAIPDMMLRLIGKDCQGNLKSVPEPVVEKCTTHPSGVNFSLRIKTSRYRLSP